MEEIIFENMPTATTSKAGTGAGEWGPQGACLRSVCLRASCRAGPTRVRLPFFSAAVATDGPDLAPPNQTDPITLKLTKLPSPTTATSEMIPRGISVTPPPPAPCRVAVAQQRLAGAVRCGAAARNTDPHLLELPMLRAQLCFFPLNPLYLGVPVFSYSSDTIRRGNYSIPSVDIRFGKQNNKIVFEFDKNEDI